MANNYKIGMLVGLRLSVEPAFFIGTLILWVILIGVGVLALNLPFSQAIILGLVAALLYWGAYIVHQLGHAYAAHQSGYPMIGIRMGTYLFFGSSLYPQNEVPLPAQIHIRRALGGPIGSFIFAIVTGIIALVLRPFGGVIWWLVIFLFLTNLVVFTLGSLLPLGFTDGSTLLEWWGER
jgi:hypothetical protein